MINYYKKYIKYKNKYLFLKKNINSISVNLQLINSHNLQLTNNDNIKLNISGNLQLINNDDDILLQNSADIQLNNNELFLYINIHKHNNNNNNIYYYDHIFKDKKSKVIISGNKLLLKCIIYNSFFDDDNDNLLLINIINNKSVFENNSKVDNTKLGNYVQTGGILDPFTITIIFYFLNLLVQIFFSQFDILRDIKIDEEKLQDFISIPGLIALGFRLFFKFVDKMLGLKLTNALTKVNEYISKLYGMSSSTNLEDSKSYKFIYKILLTIKNCFISLQINNDKLDNLLGEGPKDKDQSLESIETGEVSNNINQGNDPNGTIKKISLEIHKIIFPDIYRIFNYLYSLILLYFGHINFDGITSIFSIIIKIITIIRSFIWGHSIFADISNIIPNLFNYINEPINIWILHCMDDFLNDFITPLIDNITEILGPSKEKMCEIKHSIDKKLQGVPGIPKEPISNQLNNNKIKKLETLLKKKFKAKAKAKAKT